MKTSIVTGGGGFIGSHLVDQLIESDYDVVVIDNLSLGKLENVPTGVRFINMDARRYATLSSIFDRCNLHADVIFNLAVVPLPASISIPKQTFDENCQITSTVCELVRNEYADTLVHFSSSEVYGTAQYVPMNEGHPLAGHTPYAASKIACDALVESYGKTFGIDYSIVRPFNTIGPRQNSGSYAGVVPAIIERCLADESPIVHGSGSHTRDYSWVGDVAGAAIRIYETRATRGKVINIGSGVEVSVHDLVSLIAATMRCDRDVVHTTGRPGDVKKLCADNSLAKKLIGYEPSISFDEALDRTIEWYVRRKHD